MFGQANGWLQAELQMSDNLSAVVEIELDRLRSMLIVELRALWRAKFKSDPPKAFGLDLLRRSLAYKIQENAYGGIDSTTARLLKQLIAQHAKTPGKIVLPRRTEARRRFGPRMEGTKPSGHRHTRWLCLRR